MATREVVLCAPVRTAIGTYNGTLKDTPAPELGATAIRETLKRAGVAGDEVRPLVMGNVIQAGRQDEPGPPGRHRRRHARRGAGDDRQSRLRLRRPGDRHRCGEIGSA